MTIEKNKSLRDMNTFMLDVSSSFFANIDSKETLHRVMQSAEWRDAQHYLVLGGGSNILFSQNYHGFTLKNEIKGIEVSQENDDEIIFRVGAGESWHDFVMFTVRQQLWGIENLALIPGTVGASPIQNIGAYGSEVSEVIESVEYVSLKDGVSHTKDKHECGFSYRNSWFKEKRGELIITHVSFRLSKKAGPKNSYGKIKEILAKKNITDPSPLHMAEVIIEIRNSKLPKLGEIGMAGSFFKNPIISAKDHKRLLAQDKDLVFYELADGFYKIPAGWLLEKINCRGVWVGNVGNYKKHALVVVHNGKGTGKEVLNHVHDLIDRVQQKFNITLEPEVNIL